MAQQRLAVGHGQAPELSERVGLEVRGKAGTAAGRAAAVFGVGRVGLEAEAGWTGWMLMKLRGKGRPRPQLAVLERITLAPRQSLTLIEASGQRLLVATSADGTPAFYPVGGRDRQTAVPGKPPARVSWGRVSW
jgi:hypothetical protein